MTRPSYPHVTLSPIHFSFFPPPLPPRYAPATFFLPCLLLSPLNSLSVSFSNFFCASLLFHSPLFCFFFFCCHLPLFFPLFPFPPFSSLPHCSRASGQYQGVFSSILPCLPLSPSVSLALPPSSHFHAAHRAAMLCVFISVCGRGGGLVPATNGLLENTDSHASQSGRLGREGGRIWSEAEGRVVLERDIQGTEW